MLTIDPVIKLLNCLSSTLIAGRGDLSVFLHTSAHILLKIRSIVCLCASFTTNPV